MSLLQWLYPSETETKKQAQHQSRTRCDKKKKEKNWSGLVSLILETGHVDSTTAYQDE
jgi:hypothetical protein